MFVAELEAELTRLEQAIQEAYDLIPKSMGEHVTLGLNVLAKALRHDFCENCESEPATRETDDMVKLCRKCWNVVRKATREETTK